MEKSFFKKFISHTWLHLHMEMKAFLSEICTLKRSRLERRVLCNWISQSFSLHKIVLFQFFRD